ncbi:MAG TPA: response regulator [bacterium]|nr:response regulator [bacterium]HOL48571.1 response regulator [bacterium]HPQ19244.1 response regulator [bacterium]
MAKILLVDDAAIMRMMLQEILEEAGHTIVGEAENGQEAFDKYKELKPDLTLMDITMPNVDGIKAVQMIKEFDPGAKIIMCSAMGQKELVLKAIKCGAKDFIIKPFQEKRVIEAVNRVLGSSL